MPYVGPPFEHDIFFSYAHGVSIRDIAPLKIWSHCLIDELEATVKNIKPQYSTLAIFVDHELDPTRQLTPFLKRKIESSALLLIVMSPFYLESAWCKNEAAWFDEQMKRRGRNDGYFFVARALPSSSEDWPRYLKDENGYTLLGYAFHPEPIKEETVAFGWHRPQIEIPRHQPFYEKLESLSGDIIRRLNEIRSNISLIEGRRAQLPPVILSRLYLYARPEHAAAWQATKRMLEAGGFVVKPQAPPATVLLGEALNRARTERFRACKDCDALLILRPETGDWIEHAIATTGHNERSEIEALFDRRLPCAVLDSVGGGLPIAAMFGVGVLPATGQGWLPMLQSWLTAAAMMETAIAA